MNAASGKQEPVFDLIRSMSKAEKRNFKLYATRLSGNQEAKFVTLFDCMDSLDEYDEAKILQRCPIKKEQLPNMKAHLYKQILVSIRLLDVQRTVPMQLREQIDFARILYDKGLFRQSSKMLDKAKETALANEQYTAAIDIIDFRKKMDTLSVARGVMSKSEAASRQAIELCGRIENVNELSNAGVQLYALYLQLGYARTQKDLDMIEQFFGPRLDKYGDPSKLSFLERLYLYQAQVWYHYIRHDMLTCYKYVCRWLALFDREPQMKLQMYDTYLRGYSRLLDGLFLMRSYRRFVQTLAAFEDEYETIGSLNGNAKLISRHILYANRMNRHFWEGTFAEGVEMIPEVERFLRDCESQLNIHHRMVLCYKIACLYFGNGDHRKCMEYLGRIIGTRDPQIRRDLQCYARILNLIASYEAGIDYNLDYQVRSVYLFLIKMNDMQQVQRGIMAFLKRLNSMYETTLKDELRQLYRRLKPLEHHPYERRTFYYLDILSWLESKLKGVPVAEVIRQRFLQQNGR
ncbi:hypothetical protein [Alistipes ihumii]|uniref:hypothetical protein n=1 Tax=Alistipes ihumii TaxID=1470347 RepID=UPI00267395C9|nr:hypothetical protein [Alistipes ihumii]